VGNETKNYKFPKPSEDDFYDISEYNKALDILDETLTEMSDRKLDSNGNASDVVTEFSQEILRNNIESGEKLSVSHGKVQKWFSEMKNIAFSGLASDVAQDAAHRYVTDTEKNGWNAKVSASGGDISGTKIGSLETITSEFPVPAEGETPKVFLGKVKKFIEDTKGRYLEADVTYYVATTGSDDSGEGTQNKPFKTIQKAMNIVPKDLGGYTVTINVAEGTHVEKLTLNGYFSGKFILTGPISGNAVIDGGRERHIISNNSCAVEVAYLQFKCPTAIPAYDGLVNCTNNSFLTFLFCTFDGINTVETTNSLGVNIVGSIVELDTCVFNNCTVCIYSPVLNDKANPPGQIAIRKCTGDNNVRAYICQGSILQLKDSFLPTATETPIIATGGLVVRNTGALIGALQTYTTYYVATTGSDTTGDGTPAKPYKTIQYAINALPKNLGGFTATINVANGTYVENLYIYDYTDGTIIIKSQSYTDTVNDACVIFGSVTIGRTTAFVHINSIKVDIPSASSDSVIIDRCSLVRLAYIKVVKSNLSNNAIYASSDSSINLISCEISNHLRAIHVDYSKAYVSNCTGTGNTYGIYSASGGDVRIWGTTPDGTTKSMTGGGGTIFYDSGTQLTGLINTGLSCTWASLYGGYVRHGSPTSRAMVTIQIRVTITTALSAGVEYSVNGFPPMTSYALYALVPVNCNYPGVIQQAFMDTNGSIRITPNKALSTSDAFVLGCTYLTTQ
jgi:hypothetical protein